MLPTPNDYYEERDRWQGQTAENSARGAWAWGSVHTKGSGEIVIADPIMFGVTYTNVPTVSYGFALDDDDQLVDERFPRCSGGVLRWVRNSADFYVGAHILVTVATADPMLAVQAWLNESFATQTVSPPARYTSDPGYDITHSFTFNGLAIKDIGG